MELKNILTDIIKLFFMALLFVNIANAQTQKHPIKVNKNSLPVKNFIAKEAESLQPQHVQSVIRQNIVGTFDPSTGNFCLDNLPYSNGSLQLTFFNSTTSPLIINCSSSSSMNYWGAFTTCINLCDADNVSLFTNGANYDFIITFNTFPVNATVGDLPNGQNNNVDDDFTFQCGDFPIQVLPITPISNSITFTNTNQTNFCGDGGFETGNLENWDMTGSDWNLFYGDFPQNLQFDCTSSLTNNINTTQLV